MSATQQNLISPSHGIAPSNEDTHYATHAKNEQDIVHEESGGKHDVLDMDLIAAQRLEHALAVKPASLQGMTDEDLQALDKKMVRKMDLVIL
jgi:hypothetical protein